MVQIVCQAEYAPILSILRYQPTMMDLPWIQNKTDGTVQLDSAMLALFDRALVVQAFFIFNNYLNINLGCQRLLPNRPNNGICQPNWPARGLLQ
jgi:hypothetical protein